MKSFTKPERYYWHSQEAETRDRLKDLEHIADSHESKLDSHSQQLKWHQSALALVLWLLLQGKALEYTPTIANFVAAIIEGSLRR